MPQDLDKADPHGFDPQGEITVSKGGSLTPILHRKVDSSSSPPLGEFLLAQRMSKMDEKGSAWACGVGSSLQYRDPSLGRTLFRMEPTWPSSEAIRSQDFLLLSRTCPQVARAAYESWCRQPCHTWRRRTAPSINIPLAWAIGCPYAASKRVAPVVVSTAPWRKY